MKSLVLSLVVAVAGNAAAVVPSDSRWPVHDVVRVFRDPLLVRGDANVLKRQPIDEASWLWIAGEPGTDGDVCIFRRKFTANPGDGPLVFDVSADERFYLTLDGAFVARGPNSADVGNWQYQTYRVDLPAGEHEIRAVVTHLGTYAPIAQLSWRGGFVLKAEGVYDARLTTGKAVWEVGRVTGVRPVSVSGGVPCTGARFEIVDAGPYAVEPAGWEKTVVARGPGVMAGWKGDGGHLVDGWTLWPSQIPDQTETVVRPGTFRAATQAAAWRACHTYVEAETNAPEVASFNRLLRRETEGVTVPAHAKRQLAWHLGRYTCAYPRLTVAGGKDARVAWTWAESARDAVTKRKGLRDKIAGKCLEGSGDVFVSDGRAEAVFSTPWFRCGLWCRIDVETQDEPLEIRDLALIETRYPLEMESAFASSDDPSLQDVRRICARAMQMCCHETFFDCPYYEQLMYPGDTRVQMLVSAALTRDDRLVRRAVEIFDFATRDDGQCPFKYPSRDRQIGFTYTLCYAAMFGDYAMNHDDRRWLRARLPGLRRTMDGCELYENEDGLVENTPGWNFIDWTTEWGDTAPPSTNRGKGLNALVNLLWLQAIESAVTTERALGNEWQARYWEQKAGRLKRAIVKKFWDDKRGLLSDAPDKTSFSEHGQALAILTDCLPDDKRAVCFAHLVNDGDLARTTVYFDFYLFGAYFKMGRGDLFLRRLDLWRDYVKKGLTTTQESPDAVVDGKVRESRSDCHAWGAHPIWFMQTGLAGIRSVAPSFEKVLVAPCPGGLKEIRAKHPHPKGFVEVDLRFEGDTVSGTVKTPVPGEFVYGGHRLALVVGTNAVVREGRW